MRIRNFEANGMRTPIREWTHAGVECVIYPNPLGCGFNGYCRLPFSSPDLVIAEAIRAHENSPEEVERRRQAYLQVPGVSEDRAAKMATHEFKWVGEQLDYDAHGGLTYGPDEDGWIGFDTNHGWDDWSDDELREVLLASGNEPVWLHFNEMKRVLDRGDGLSMWPPGRLSKGDPWYLMWNLDMLVAEVNRLAVQIAAKHLVETPKDAPPSD